MTRSISESDWGALNALADGALGRQEAKALRRRIDIDPNLAAEFDRILALKQALQKLRAAPQEAANESAGRRSWSRLRRAAAASIVFVICAGFALSSLILSGNGEETVAEIHKAFSEETYILNSGGGLTLSSGAGIGALNAPDLTPSNLTLVDVRAYRGDAGERVAMHYRGRRGCRVTLIADTLSLPVEEEIPGVGLVYRWGTSNTRFVLLADGMDEDRFAAIGAFAEAASRLSEEREERRVALVDRTARARPCA